MVKFGWDKLKRFLAQANTWTGQQTFSNIAVTGGTISGVTFAENFTSATDPAANAAVSTTIVNTYNGTVVTLTAAGNTQTLQSPTTAATIRKFMVINNDTSNNNLSVVANSVTFTLTPGEGQCFIWDGSAWGPTDLGITSLPVLVTQGGTGASTLTDHGVLLGSGTGAITPLGVATNGQLIIGSTGADPVVASITDGEGIDTTGGAGTLTIACEDASTSNKGVTVYSGNTKALAGTDTASAMTPKDTADAIAVNTNPKAMSQGVAMTAAASGSSGITVADNDNIDFGTGNFTLVWKGSLPDWTPSSDAYLMNKYDGSAGPRFTPRDTGSFLRVTSSAVYTLPACTITDGTVGEVTIVVVRETASTDGSITLYNNGVQVGSSVTITAGVPPSYNSTSALYICGTNAIRYASRTHHAYTFNRALTAAEVLDLYRNGIAPKHRKASQTALTSGTLVTGQEYTIDTFAAGDDFANVGGTNETGNVFVATGTTPTTWTNSSSLRATGGTLILEPEGIQPAGANSQWLDSSSNKLNATLPAAGATNTRKIDSGRYPWSTAMTDDTTWTSILPAGFVLEKVIFNNSTANACELRLGTSAGGTQMAATITIAASTFTTATIDKVVSLTADTTLYLSDTGAGWNSASLTATLFFRRFN